MFGESFVKNLGRYVGTFSSFHKAHTSMRKVFQKRVSTRASRPRSGLSGCNASSFSITEAPSLLQPLFKAQEMHQQFFPVMVGPGELDKTEVPMDPEDLMVSPCLTQSSSLPPEGRRLSHFCDAWVQITAVSWVLETI